MLVGDRDANLEDGISQSSKCKAYDTSHPSFHKYHELMKRTVP